MKINILRNLRLFRVDDDRLEKHLLDHLRDLKSQKQDEEDTRAFGSSLSMEDRCKVARRAKIIINERRQFDQGRHLRRDERDQLRRLSEGVDLHGPSTLHQADEIAAALYEEMPWLQSVIVDLWHDMRHHLEAGGLGLKIQPTLLVSEPGMGKTHLINRLAELCGVPSVQIDGGSGSEAFPVAGVGRGWGSSEPGRPLKAVIEHSVGNPIVSIDEIDKAGIAHSESGVSTSLHHALLGLLEPVSAKNWVCPAYQSRST